MTDLMSLLADTGNFYLYFFSKLQPRDINQKKAIPLVKNQKRIDRKKNVKRLPIKQVVLHDLIGLKITAGKIRSSVKDQYDLCTKCGQTVYPAEKREVSIRDSKEVFHKTCFK